MADVTVIVIAIVIVLYPRSLDTESLESIGILEQATAACWGSLAVIDRCEIGLIQPSFLAQPVSLSDTRIPAERMVQTSSKG